MKYLEQKQIRRIRISLATTVLCMLITLSGILFAEEVTTLSGIQGGLIVQLGWNNPDELLALQVNEKYLVQGLDQDPDRVRAARETISAKGAYGSVTAESWNGSSLPYADNLVNLIVLSDSAPQVAESELMRVLCPNGAICERKDGRWITRSKPWPKDIDEWTHYLHDAAGTCVANDTVVGQPRQVQWLTDPLWTRAHEKMSSFSAMVSAHGRVFSILDEAPIASMAMEADWQLIARDAFNGKLLWKKPITDWWPTSFGFKSGPVLLTRRLVAMGDKVYVTMGCRAPLSILDSATGDELITCPETAGTEEIIVEGDTVFISGHAPEITAEKLPTWIAKDKPADQWSFWHPEKRWIKALNAQTGEVLWEHNGMVNPQTLIADTSRVYYHDGAQVVALDRKTGQEIWTSDPAPFTSTPRSDFRANLAVSAGVVIFSGGPKTLPSYDAGYNDMLAFSAETGKQLWKGPHLNSGYESPKDLFIIDGRVWSGATTHNKPDPKINATAGTGLFVGHDMQTGESVSLECDAKGTFFHHRCYPAKATSKYFITSRQGTELIDIQSGHWDLNDWVRGSCLYGLMPANGLLYFPPHPCGCMPLAKLNGFWTLAAESKTARPELTESQRFEKGPAFGKTRGKDEPTAWPTYRHDTERSSFSAAEVPAELAVAWQAELGGTLSAPTVAEGKVFVAQVDEHRICALEEQTGKPVWTFTAGGRIDTPPTLTQGLALFGSADGWVYALRTTDGALAWRYHVAPSERKIVAYDQLESAWPVSGAVLVRGDKVYCLAGRSIFLDGGMYLACLNVQTGDKRFELELSNKKLSALIEQNNLRIDLSLNGARADILVADENYIYLKTLKIGFDGTLSFMAPEEQSLLSQFGEKPKESELKHPHIFAAQGFLDATWHHRSYTVYGEWYESGSGGFYQAAGVQPSGRLLAFDKDKVYGYGKKPEYFGWTTAIEYRLFEADRTAKVEPLKKRQGYSLKTTFETHWSEDVPLHVRALVKAGDTLFLAGSEDLFDEGPAKQYGNITISPEKAREVQAAWEGKNGGVLWAVSAADGKKLAALKLDSPPAWDAMAAAGGRLFIPLKNGSMLCLTGK